jgi:hypothetical protein
MPANVVKPGQEEAWKRAKAAAKKQGQAKNYRLIMHIFKQITKALPIPTPGEDDEDEDVKKAKEKIPGGLGAGKPDSAFNAKALAAGIKVEMEHTTSRKVAKEIAKDHLTEDPKYYEKLKTIEKGREPVHTEDDMDPVAIKKSADAIMDGAKLGPVLDTFGADDISKRAVLAEVRRQKAELRKAGGGRDELRKSLLSYSDLRKGLYGGRVGEWADQFMGTPLYAEALQCLKDRTKCQKELQAVRAKHKDWNELQEMPKSKREKVREKQRKQLEPHYKKQEAFSAKVSALEEKLLDHKLEEAKEMGKSWTASPIPFDNLAKAGEGSRGGKIVGHTAAGKPIYDHKEASKYHWNAMHNHPKGSDAEQAHYEAAHAHETVHMTGNRFGDEARLKKRARDKSKHAASFGEPSEEQARTNVKDRYSEAKKATPINIPTMKGGGCKKATPINIPTMKGEGCRKSLVERGLEQLFKAKKAAGQTSFSGMGGKGEGTRGGKIIGHTRGGHPIYASQSKSDQKARRGLEEATRSKGTYPNEHLIDYHERRAKQHRRHAGNNNLTSFQQAAHKRASIQHSHAAGRHEMARKGKDRDEQAIVHSQRADALTNEAVPETPGKRPDRPGSILPSAHMGNYHHSMAAHHTNHAQHHSFAKEAPAGHVPESKEARHSTKRHRISMTK